MARPLRSRFLQLRAFALAFAQWPMRSAQIGQLAMEALRMAPRHQEAKSLVRHGYKVYSQSDEDGMINEIFNRIQVSNKIFIEFGIGNGLENNTFALLFQNWTGLWIDSDRKLISEIRAGLPRTLESGALSVLNSFITRENIDGLISSKIKETEIDLLSIDIDGNDFHVFDAINCVVPRVVVIEYNAKFPPPIKFCIDYDASHVWQRDDCFGASLSFLEERMRLKGYCLVGCNLAGTNAFFVRQDLVEDKFLAPFSAEIHFQPPRYYLAELPSGHRPSFGALEKSSNSR
jgi:hypothetical protein